MKKVLSIFGIFILAITFVFMFSACGSDDAKKEATNQVKISQADLGFEQWIPVIFFDNENPLSKVAVSAPNKCLIIRKGSLQVNDASSQKCMYLKDSFGNVFSINFETVNIDVVSELTGAFIPDGTICSMTKADYEQMWTLDGIPYYNSSTDTKIRKILPETYPVFLHLTLSQIDDLYQQ